MGLQVAPPTSDDGPGYRELFYFFGNSLQTRGFGGWGSQVNHAIELSAWEKGPGLGGFKNRMSRSGWIWKMWKVENVQV